MVDISPNTKLKWGTVTRKTLRNMIELKNPDQAANVDPNRLYRRRFFKVKASGGEWLIGDMGPFAQVLLQHYERKALSAVPKRKSQAMAGAGCNTRQTFNVALRAFMSVIRRTWPYGTRYRVKVIHSNRTTLVVNYGREAFVLVGHGVVPPPKIGTTGVIEFTQGGPTGGFWKWL